MAEYVIRIINDTNAEKRRAVANSSGDGDKSTTPQKGDDKGRSTAGRVYVAYKKFVAPFVSSAINHQIGTVALRTGRVEYQQQLQFAYNMASKVVGVAESAIAGYAVGGGIGAVAGVAISGLQWVVSYAQRVDTINKERSLESITLGLQNVRAGGSVSAYNGSRG